MKLGLTVAIDRASEPLSQAAAALARTEAERRLEHAERAQEAVRLALTHVENVPGHTASRLAALLVEAEGLAADIATAVLVEHPELRETEEVPFGGTAESGAYARLRVPGLRWSVRWDVLSGDLWVSRGDQERWDAWWQSRDVALCRRYTDTLSKVAS